MSNLDEIAVADLLRHPSSSGTALDFQQASFVGPGSEASLIQLPADESAVIRLLNAQQILLLLGRVLPRKPCHRTLQRWAQGGLPYLLHPGSRQRLYIFGDVYQWLCSRRIRRNLEQEAIDRSHFGRPTRKSIRKSA